MNTSGWRGGKHQKLRNGHDGELGMNSAQVNTVNLRRRSSGKIEDEESWEPSEGAIDPTRTSSRRGGQKTKLRIGTMNVPILRGKMDLMT